MSSTSSTAKGLLVESDGALCVFPPGFANRDGEPLPLIVRKSDEGYGYAATDLAAIRERAGQADLLLYVVGTPQSQHFEMVFAAARMAGWLGEGCAPSTWPSATCSGATTRCSRPAAARRSSSSACSTRRPRAPGPGSTRAAGT